MKRLAQITMCSLLCLGSLAIALSSIVYFIPGERAPFLIEKLPLPAENLYLWTLRLHVIAAALSLPGCLIGSSKTILQRWPKFHRWCGRAVGGIALMVLVPSGFYLSFFARGGLGGTLGFQLSGAIVTAAMVLAIRDARAKRFGSHRRWAYHVLGQLSVAVTSRAMLHILESSNMHPDKAYLISLWVPVLATFLLVERIASPAKLKAFPRSLYEHMVAYAGPSRRDSPSIR